jgi:hypothetical protein
VRGNGESSHGFIGALYSDGTLNWVAKLRYYGVKSRVKSMKLWFCSPGAHRSRKIPTLISIRSGSV